MDPKETPPARILVVDDEEMVRNFLQRMLERQGYAVDVAATGEEGMARARGAQRPDAILLDLNMPGISGADVCRALKQDPDTSAIPVILLSGDDAWKSQTMGRDAGASDFLTKPFERERVLQRLNEAIEAARA
jgi:two-component system response regulator MprA